MPCNSLVVGRIDPEAHERSTPIPGVREIAPGFYSVSSEPEPCGPVGRTWRALRGLLIGAPLPTRLERSERLGMLAALAILGADSIASSVYGPEAMMRMLGEAGPGAVALALPVGVCIVALLAVRAISYQQATAGAHATRGRQAPSSSGGAGAHPTRRISGVRRVRCAPHAADCRRADWRDRPHRPERRRVCARAGWHVGRVRSGSACYR